MLTGTPVLVMILSAFMFKNSDKCTLLKVLASCLFVAGVTLSNIKDLTNVTPVSINYKPNLKTRLDIIKPGTNVKRQLQENVGQSIGYCFAAGALFFSAFGSVLTKKISKNFDKKIISSVIGFSILIIAFCTPFLDNLLAMAMPMPMHTRDVDTYTFFSA